MPEVSAAYAWVAARPVETMPAAELAETWDEVWARIGRCWSIHFFAIRGPYQVLDDLADLYESVIEAATPGEALGLIGGGDHELQAVERGLEELARLVARTPGLAERLVEPGVTVDDLAAFPGAAPFASALEAFLDEHGHLGQQIDDLSLPSWAEEPGLFLAELAKRVRTPTAVGVEERRSRLAAEADALADRARSALAGDPARSERFEELLADARRIGHLTETHNYWIDRMAQASLRRFVVRVGRRLVEAGSIARAGGHLPSPSRRGPRPAAATRGSPAGHRGSPARPRTLRGDATAAPCRASPPRTARAIDSMAPGSPRPNPTSCAAPARPPASSGVRLG